MPPRPRPERRSPARSRPSLEILEGRQLLATFSVTNLNAAGAGSLRQAILRSNMAAGADAVAFDVAGTIRVGRAPLPSITDTLTIDGASAPSFAGSPVVTVDFRGSKGLKFARGADGSTLRSLALVGAGNSGVTLAASRVTVEGNFIGLRADGKTLAGNGGDGVRIEARSRGNLIGREDPVTRVSYFNADAVTMQPVSGWQGIRGADQPGRYLISGTSGASGLLFVGGIDGRGESYPVNFPGAASTSVYGPDNREGDGIRLVGSYKNADASTSAVAVNGFLFEGTSADLPSGGSYRTISYPGARFNYVHSTMGNLAVGNYDGPTSSGQPIGAGHAYVYDVEAGTFVADVVYPGSVSNSVYGIWHDGGTKYTLCGGTTTVVANNLDDQERPIGQGFLVDYDAATGRFTRWKLFDYPNGPPGVDFVTHFEGISGVESGVYTLSADSVQAGSTAPTQGSFVTVRRQPDGSFGEGVWVDLDDPEAEGLASSNSVFGDQVVGIVIGPSGATSYQATVGAGFQLSNVIGGNLGNGVGVYGSSDNRVAMNFLGTDATGKLRRGNRKNGILVTRRAARNLIGGQATGGNDPTAGVFVRPPQGNLISGNRANGVLVDGRSTKTLLSGNFVGTAASGNAALGNRLDGVAIDGADGNELIGCTLRQSPFVFYNVLSGNGGNGLRITDSNDTTVQANFLGTGADNARVVPNGGNGLLVSGSSATTQVGGVIPLGNVISGNARNGIEVRDTARGFTSFNTFAGIHAFGAAAPNRRNGILVTSSGGDNLIRTCIVSGNLGNGIELGGRATGVQVTDTAVGTNTNIQTAIPNGGSGVRFSGDARGNAIGGFQPSVEPQVTISSNRRYGIEFVGKARENVVYHTYIGTDFNAEANLGNAMGGVAFGRGTSSNTVGGTDPARRNKILHSGGDGAILRSSRRNRVMGNEIAGSRGYGLGAKGFCAGSVVKGNVIAANAEGDVDLAGSRGVVYVPLGFHRVGQQR